MLISAMFTNGFVLKELASSTLVLISKPRLDACISNSYRSIALCSIIGIVACTEEQDCRFHIILLLIFLLGNKQCIMRIITINTQTLV